MQQTISYQIDAIQDTLSFVTIIVFPTLGGPLGVKGKSLTPAQIELYIK